MAILHVTSENFESVIQSQEPVLIDFFAEWCGPCKALAPVLEEVAAETGATIGKVDVDQSPELAEQFGVMSVPTLMVFQNGEAVETSVGVIPKAELLRLLGK